MNNLDSEIRKSESINIFKSNISEFIRPKPNNVYCCHNPKGIRISGLGLGLSHHREHNLSIAFKTGSILLASVVMTKNIYSLPTLMSYYANKIKSINCKSSSIWR